MDRENGPIYYSIQKDSVNYVVWFAWGSFFGSETYYSETKKWITTN